MEEQSDKLQKLADKLAEKASGLCRDPNSPRWVLSIDLTAHVSPAFRIQATMFLMLTLGLLIAQRRYQLLAVGPEVVVVDRLGAPAL